MFKVDMWYKDSYKNADKIDITFYPNSGDYRGNIYKNDKAIGDYICTNSVELENNFPQLQFRWE